MTMSLQNIITKTGEYLGVPAVVRFEYPYMTHLVDDFNTPGYEVERQNKLIVVRKKGTKSGNLYDKIQTIL